VVGPQASVVGMKLGYWCRVCEMPSASTHSCTFMDGPPRIPVVDVGPYGAMVIDCNGTTGDFVFMQQARAKLGMQRPIRHRVRELGG
jgi:hypothetical protein